jgi:hypothetical protein
MAGIIHARCYIETSAKTGEGIATLFSTIVEELIRAPKLRGDFTVMDDNERRRVYGELFGPQENPMGPTAKKYVGMYTRVEDPSNDNRSRWMVNDSERMEGPLGELKASKRLSSSASQFFKRLG